VPLSSADAAHLLRRAGFTSHRPADVQALVGLEPLQAADQLLAFARTPEPGPARLHDSNRWYGFEDSCHTWLNLMARGPQVREKLAFFWNGLLTCAHRKIDYPPAQWDLVNLFRTHGAGSFRDLLQAVAVSPAMLAYLDNATNVAGAPNLNFARELFELFCLGSGNYSESDVGESARAWTGFGLDGWTYRFNPAQHDGGQKTIFGETAAWTGPQVIDRLFLAGSPQRAALCRHLARELVAYYASPRLVDAAIATAVAAALDGSGADVATALRTLWSHPEFYGDEARFGRVKSPVEWVVTLLATSGLEAGRFAALWRLSLMGQEPLSPPNVDGWPSSDMWITATSFFVKAMHGSHWSWALTDPNEAYRMLANSPSLSPQQAVTAAFAALGVDVPTPGSVARITEWLTTERREAPWMERSYLLQQILLSPEFQLA
jgi:uncharacterized protein (DUF1800 family)